MKISLSDVHCIHWPCTHFSFVSNLVFWWVDTLYVLEFGCESEGDIDWATHLIKSPSTFCFRLRWHYSRILYSNRLTTWKLYTLWLDINASLYNIDYKKIFTRYVFLYRKIKSICLAFSVWSKNLCENRENCVQSVKFINLINKQDSFARQIGRCTQKPKADTAILLRVRMCARTTAAAAATTCPIIPERRALAHSGPLVSRTRPGSLFAELVFPRSCHHPF